MSEERTSMSGEKVIPTINPPASQSKDEGGQPAKGTPAVEEIEDGISQIPDKTSSKSTDLIPTIGVEPKAKKDEGGKSPEDKKPGDEGKKAEGEEGKEPDEKPTEKEGEEDTRFDKHPRFQELHKERNTYRDRALQAEAKIEALEKVGLRPKEEPRDDEDFDYENVIEMEDVDIRSKFEENPKLFLANFGRQIAAETSKIVLSKVDARENTRTTQSKIEKTYDAFADKNPDFLDMVSDGRIKSFLDKNPGHNHISAYHELTAADREAKQKEAEQKRIDEAVKKREAELHADYKAKRSAATLGEPGAGLSRPTFSEEAPELMDTKKHGGLTNALVARLRARRAARG